MGITLHYIRRSSVSARKVAVPSVSSIKVDDGSVFAKRMSGPEVESDKGEMEGELTFDYMVGSIFFIRLEGPYL